MKNISLILVGLLLLTYVCNAQQWGRFNTSKNCNNNIQAWNNSASARMDDVRSVVKIIFESGGSCTGTLLNQETSTNSIRYLILTAEHCIYGNITSPDDNVDLEQEQVGIVFNYQSRDFDNNNTAGPNRGFSDAPIIPNPTIAQLIGENSTGYGDNHYEYIHITRLSRVSRSHKYGDMVLLEMETPPPPHFNYYFAGWDTRIMPATAPTLPGYGYPFVNIHHPSGDIKKGTGSIMISDPWGSSHGCKIVTRLIDRIFGRINSSQVICNYLSFPYYYTTPVDGITEGGSSGSPMFGPNRRVMGTLTGASSFCNAANVELHGELAYYYYYRDVKNTLNPHYDKNVNDRGIDGRQISCYQNLTLGNGAVYFPAAHYQDENAITLSAVDRIVTNGNLTILGVDPTPPNFAPDYTFTAGNDVELNPGFEVRDGGNFEIRIQGCTQNKPSREQNTILSRLDEVRIPKELRFNIEDHLTPIELDNARRSIRGLNIYPNPNSGSFTLELPTKGSYEVQVVTMIGTTIYKQTFNNTQKANIELNNSLPNGNYSVHIIGDGMRHIEKISVIR